MKKGFTLLLVICLLFVSIPQRANANLTSEELELQRQEEIDSIFQEMNEIITTKNHITYLETLGISIDQTQYSKLQLGINEKTNVFDKRVEELDLLLAKLDVIKVDPNNEVEMAMLTELSETSTPNGRAAPSGAPDLSFLASDYSVYITDGGYSYLGTTYYTRSIRVVDTKSKKLTLNNTYNTAPANLSSSVANSMLSYNFGYVFSYYLGKTPQGMVIDWTLGNIFSFLDGIKASQGLISSSSDPLYRIFVSSVTQMRYHYFYNPTYGWKQIAASSDVTYAQTHFFAGNVDGEPKHVPVPSDNWSSSSGNSSAYEYARDYVYNMSTNPHYITIDRLGSFGVRGYGSTFTYTPRFYDVPTQL